MRRFSLSFFLLLCSLCSVAAAKDLLIPLDDRPANLLFVEQIARIGRPQESLVVPPRNLLGRLYRPGDSQALIEWADSQLQSGDTLFVCIDMWLYGGLVASRTADINQAVVRDRLERLREIGERGVFVHVLATVPRLSLRTSDSQAPHERKLAKWAAKGDLPSARTLLGQETGPFPTGVPDEYVREYLGVRVRNLDTILELIGMAQVGFVDSLVLGQDDSHKTGLHRFEQTQIREEIARLRVSKKVTLLSGIDELTMSMVSGVWANRSGFRPTVRVLYGDPAAAKKVPPLESIPLETMVAQHLKLAGAEQVSDQQADLDLMIYTPYSKPWKVPGEERRPASEAFARSVESQMASGRQVAVADLSLVNRMDPFLAETALQSLNLFELEAFASWNTPANTVGTVISQAVCHQIAEHSDWTLNERLESEKTHQAFLFARFLDDYAYQTVVRAEVKPLTKGLSPKAEPLLNLFGPVGLQVRLRLKEWAESLFAQRYLGRTMRLQPQDIELEFTRSKLEVVLPWPRTFEVEARLDLRMKPR